MKTNSARAWLDTMVQGLLALALVAMSPTYTPSPEAEGLNSQAQEAFLAGDYAVAAELWKEIHSLLPEGKTNREERDNVLLLALDSFMTPYRDVPPHADLSARQLRRHIRFLKAGVDFFHEYEREFDRVHRTEISATARLRGTELEGLLEEAELELDALAPPVTPPDPCPGCKGPKWPPIDDSFRGPSGVGLITAGSVLVVMALATTPLIIVGARKGDREGTAMLATGAVLGTTFLVAGGTMLGIGIKRRVRYIAFAPAVRPRYAGFGFSGRF